MSLADEARDLRRRIEARMRELQPYVAEYEDLRRTAEAMGIDADAKPTTAPPGPLGSSPAPTSTTVNPAGRSARRRSAASVELRRQILEVVAAHPGETVSDYAQRLDLTASVLYRPIRELTAEGSLIKTGRRLSAR